LNYLVTGAEGSVGIALVRRLDGVVHPTDIVHDDRYLDVTDPNEVARWVKAIRPDVIYHLAGAKHAPDGELHPANVAAVNINGTLNVLDAAKLYGAKVVMTSTCKACDPETAYGASKLIAERATLNVGGVVVRFHNIPESSGNVFRLWEQLDPGEPLPVTDCWRYFTPLEKAVGLLVAAAEFPTGRYSCDPGESRRITDVAAELYPGREQVAIPARRGDRRREPLIAACENLDAYCGWLRITGVHDPVPVALRVAA
jgi:FlaA1/EpsC-like NDP-sugar epimerase